MLAVSPAAQATRTLQSDAPSPSALLVIISNTIVLLVVRLILVHTQQRTH